MPSHKNVLVADDDLAQRKMIQHCLEQFGHTVTTAADGREALELARSMVFDLVILDVDMPHMNGFEVLRHLRTEAAYNDSFIAMVTARNKDDEIMEGYGEGANMYLTKPVTPAQLAQAFG
ncbi:MAG: response regulator [Fimbriimonas sp.]